MLANQRREKIFELIQEDGSAKVINLAKIFKVTEVTIRQDLEKIGGMGDMATLLASKNRFCIVVGQCINCNSPPNSARISSQTATDT